jgi:hypothetical protein
MSIIGFLPRSTGVPGFFSGSLVSARYTELVRRSDVSLPIPKSTVDCDVLCSNKMSSTSFAYYRIDRIVNLLMRRLRGIKRGGQRGHIQSSRFCLTRQAKIVSWQVCGPAERGSVHAAYIFIVVVPY